MLLLIELSATALFWIRDQARSIQTDPAMPMTTARNRIRAIPQPNVDVPGVHTDGDGWRVQKPGESLFTGYSGSDYNVVLFGGSTMWGTGVKDDETITAYLRSMITAARSRDGRPVRIFNAGVVDNSLHQEAYLLADFLREGRRIDLAVFYDGVNEECTATNKSASNEDLAERIEVEDRAYVQFRALMNVANQEPRVLAQNFKTVRLARGIWRRLFTRESLEVADAPEQAEICAKVYITDARFARQLARAWGTEAVFVLQPGGAFISRASTYSYPIDGPLPQSLIQFYRMLYAHIDAGAPGSALDIRDWSGMLEVPFQEGVEIFLDSQHLTNRGNAIVAQKFYDMLILDGRIATGRPAGR